MFQKDFKPNPDENNPTDNFCFAAAKGTKFFADAYAHQGKQKGDHPDRNDGSQH